MIKIKHGVDEYERPIKYLSCGLGPTIISRWSRIGKESAIHLIIFYLAYSQFGRCLSMAVSAFLFLHKKTRRSYRTEQALLDQDPKVIRDFSLCFI